MSNPPAANGMSIDKIVSIVLLSLDADLAARVLRCMGDDSLDRLTRAMKELGEMAVDSSSVDAAYRSMVERMRSGSRALGNVDTAMEAILVKAFGEDRGRDVSQRANQDILVRKPFAVFESLPPQDLANLLAEEHPQIAAVFMAHLDRAKAGRVLSFVADAQRAELLHRVATLDRTPPDVVQRVLDVMRQKVKDLGLTTLRSEPKAWIKAAAEILNNVGGGEKSILEQVAELDGGIAGAIREEMFTFDDLSKLDRKAMQKVLSQVDSRDLALAIKATTAEVEANVFNNLSKRAAGMVKEERDTLGPTPLSEVLEAQQRILTQVRDMLDRGEISAAATAEALV
jgi:flagellar motor switch protein FliG